MQKNMYVLLITLIVGVYFGFDPGTVRAQFYDVSLETDAELDYTTLQTDTNDFTIALVVVNFGDTDTITLDIELETPDGNIVFLTDGRDLSSPTLDKYSVTLELLGEEDITLTVPSTTLSAVGQYIVTVSASSTGDSSVFSSQTFYFNVKAPPTKLYDPRIIGVIFTLKYGAAGLTVQGWPFRLSDTEDATYTLYVGNNGTKLDQMFLTVSGELENATLTPPTVVLRPGSEGIVTLTIPRASFSKRGIFEMTVTAVSENDATASATFLTHVYVTDDRESIPDPTPPIPDPSPPITDPSPQKVILSEFMFETGGGSIPFPQWIEVYNSGSSTVNLRGWKLHLKLLQLSLLETTITFKEDFIIPPQQPRLIVTNLGIHSKGGNLSGNSVYHLGALHAEELAQGGIANHNRLITRGGFSLKLTNAEDELIDHIGTLEDNKQTWELPVCLIDRSIRSSLIRRFDEGVPRSGIERNGWMRAYDAIRLIGGVYYGRQYDISTPGYRRGKPLPVELSQFSAKFVKDEVVINWTTESELDNAGFNIFRSTSRAKNFQRINTKLIQGAGTTGERNTYQFIDKTAKPNVSYYYRLEDVDLSGTRGIFTPSRLRGVITPTGKTTATWGTLKDAR